MILNEQQRKDFEEAAKPLIRFMNEHCSPHTTVIVNATSAELLESAAMVTTEEFLRD